MTNSPNILFQHHMPLMDKTFSMPRTIIKHVNHAHTPEHWIEYQEPVVAANDDDIMVIDYEGTLSISLALCGGNPLMTDGLNPSQKGPVMCSLHIFFVVRLNLSNWTLA